MQMEDLIPFRVFTLIIYDSYRCIWEHTSVNLCLICEKKHAIYNIIYVYLINAADEISLNCSPESVMVEFQCNDDFNVIHTDNFMF